MAKKENLEKPEEVEADIERNDSRIKEGPKKQGKENNSKAAIISSIFAAVFLLFMLVPIGMLLAILAVGFMVPKIVEIIKTKKLPEENAGKIIAASVVSVSVLVMGIVISCRMFIESNEMSIPEVEQEYSTLEQLDVNGLTVSEACNKIRDAGWKILRVEDEKNSGQSSGDCSDETHKVTSVVYHSKKYDYGGTPNSKYEKAVIMFSGEDDATKKETDTSSSESKPSSSDSGQSSSNSSSNSSASNDSGASSSSNSEACKESYKKDLEASRAAYEMAVKNYDVYKNMGLSAEDLATYKNALDMSKNALDAAQQLYDIYCK